MAKKNIVQTTPLSITVRGTPQLCATLPARRFPKGINPAKVNIKTLISLPLNSSGTSFCKTVFIRLIAVTEAQPKSIKAIKDKRYDLDAAKNTRERENVIAEKIKSFPLCLKSPNLARPSAAISAPTPVADMSIPRPLTPTFKISLAKTGIKVGEIGRAHV